MNDWSMKGDEDSKRGVSEWLEYEGVNEWLVYVKEDGGALSSLSVLKMRKEYD